MNQTLVESARCMLQHAKLDNCFGGEALMTANLFETVVQLDRLQPTQRHMKSGMESNQQAKCESFGCEAYVHVPSELRRIWHLKSKKCVFLGYGDHENVFRLMDLATTNCYQSCNFGKQIYW